MASINWKCLYKPKKLFLMLLYKKSKVIFMYNIYILDFANSDMTLIIWKVSLQIHVKCAVIWI